MGVFDWLKGRPTREDFAQRMIEALREAGDPREIEYDEGEYRLLMFEEGKVSQHLNLANLFADHCQLPKSSRNDHVKAMVRAALSHLKEIPEEFTDASHDLRPRIWPRAAFEKADLQQRIEGQQGLDLPQQYVGEHLVATLVFDLPESVRTISQDELDRWGVTYYEAFEVARQQLGEDEFRFVAVGDSLYASLGGDTYDASRILLLDLIRQLDVQGRPVAMIPHRDMLLLTGSEDQQGLELMLDFADKEYEEASRPLLPTALLLDDDAWVDWRPPANHVLYPRFCENELKYLYAEYLEQKELLDTVHEREGRHIHVARFTPVEQEETRELSSYSVWSRTVDTLLPRTSAVAFYDPDHETIVASAGWDRVQKVVGHLMQKTEDYPVRYRVHDFPNREQLERLSQDGL